MMKTRAGQWGAGRLLESLFPPLCGSCGATVAAGDDPVCALCRTRLPVVHPPWCIRCGATRLLQLPELEGCPACADWPDWLPRGAAPFRMTGVAARLVHALKYGGVTALADFMASAMRESVLRVWGEHGRSSDAACLPVLVPIPLSRARARARGYNQAALLADCLARREGWKSGAWLCRARTGKTQAGSGRQRRARNVSGMFSLARGAGRPCGPAVLVDDVLTTGATAGECAHVLHQAGVPCAGVVTFARALPETVGF